MVRRTARQAFDEIYLKAYGQGLKGEDAFEKASEEFENEFDLEPPYKTHGSYKASRSKRAKRRK